MRSQTPLAPSEPAFDVTVHIGLNDFGPLGRAYVDTDETQADEATVVEDILSGQYYQPHSGGCLQHRRRLGARRDRGHCECRAEQGAERTALNRDGRAGVFWSGRSEWMCLWATE